jgi:hypothetical protein|tara:strand:+ start:2141 stop:3511 length:1371 start_codon:yes stop_codon:yes gene_type:complete
MQNVKFNTFKTPEHVINNAANTANVGLWEATKTSAYQAWNFNPTSSIFRAFEQQAAERFDDTILSKEDLNRDYAGLGLFFEEDTRKGMVDYLVQRKKIERARSQTLSKAPQSLGAKGVYLGAGLITSFGDPINIAASFIPVVREARFASLVAKLGATRARMTKGAIEGFVGNALVEPIVYKVAKSEQADYDYQDSILNLVAGTVLGSGLHVGFGRVGDAIAKARGKDNIYQRLAKSHPEFKEELFNHTLNKVLNNEKVNTGEVINSSRLNNQDLIDIDNTKARLKKDLADNRRKLNDEGEQIFKDKQDVKAKLAALKMLDPKRKLKYIGNLKKIKELENQLKDLEAREKAVVEKVVKENAASSRVKNTTLTSDDTSINPNKIDKSTENNAVQSEEIEAEDLSLQAQNMEKQLNNEAISQFVAENNVEMKIINNKIKQKSKIRDAIKAGANCVFRRN